MTKRESWTELHKLVQIYRGTGYVTLPVETLRDLLESVDNRSTRRAESQNLASVSTKIRWIARHLVRGKFNSKVAAQKVLKALENFDGRIPERYESRIGQALDDVLSQEEAWPEEFLSALRAFFNRYPRLLQDGRLDEKYGIG